MVDIKIYRGTTYDMTYNHTDTDGEPVSLVGKKIYFTVKDVQYDDDATDTDAAIKKTITSHADAAGGISDWTLNDADTEIPVGTYYYDVVIEDVATGLSDPPVLIGKFTVKGKRTNRNVGNEV